MFQYQELLYIPEIIRFKVISCHYNDLLAGHFGIDKTRELVGRKYYWLSLRRDIKTYVQECAVCLTSKTVRHKPFGDLQSLPIPSHQWKDLFMHFVTRSSLFSHWKDNNYNSILIIIDQLITMVHYKLVKVTINTPRLAKVMIDVGI